MDAAQSLQLHHLRREILSSRDAGRLVIEFSDGVEITNLAEARHLADGMLALVNLPMLGPHWFEANRPRATSVLTASLHWDLEKLRARVPLTRAVELTEKIFSLFHDNAIYLTNVRPSADLTKSPHRWASGTETDELDAGVAIVSPELIGLIWIEDRP